MTSTFPPQIKPMLSVNEAIAPEELHKYEGTHLAQIKWDGTRIVVVKYGDQVHLMSRSWKNDFADAYPEITNELKQLPGNIILDGELVFLRKSDGKPEFRTALSTDETKKDFNPTLMLFDILEMSGGMNVQKENQEARSMMVHSIVTSHNWKHVKVVDSKRNNFKQMFDEIIADGGEGIMIKDIKGIYQDDKRTKTWRKVKRTEDHDCFVLGAQGGKGKYEGSLGALIIGQLIDGKVQIVARCSGMDDALRASLYKDIMAMDSPPDSLELYPYWKGNEKDVVKKVYPLMVCAVKCMERNPKTGVMRIPIFLRIRDDKKWDECVWERDE
jgi:bifunctional non-homologous end joining protein LigD